MDKDEKIVKFILAALFYTARLASGNLGPQAPTERSFDLADQFIAAAKAKDCFPEFPPDV